MDSDHLDVPSYTVEHRGNCILVFGAVPASAFSSLTRLVPKKSVMNVQLAHIAGCSMALGLAEDTKKLILEMAPDPLIRTRLSYANTGLSEAALRWLAAGERDASSDAMFFGITGVKPYDMSGQVSAYPLDPDEFRRCRLLYEQVPEVAARIEAASSISQVWAQIVVAWYTLCAAMDSECPDWRSGKVKAPRTHEMLQRETTVSLNFL